MPPKSERIKITKGYRKALDAILQDIVTDGFRTSEKFLAITKLKEAIMWLGMDLKELNDGVSCYKEGYNPDSAVVEPVADGLQL